MGIFRRSTTPTPARVGGHRYSRTRDPVELRTNSPGKLRAAPDVHRSFSAQVIAVDDTRRQSHSGTETALDSLVPDSMPTTVTEDDDAIDVVMELSSSTAPQARRRVVGAVHNDRVEPKSNLYYQRNIQEMAALRDRVAALEAELHFADRELRKVKDREQKLLDKILDKSQGGQFYDSDLVHSFRNIREEIQRLAKSPLYTTGGNTRRPWVAENSDNEAFFEQWYGVPRKERQLLIRGEMFGYLHRYIFACNLFGISATGVAEALTFRDMETNLNHFERVLQNQGVEEDVVTDWRVTTLKCIRLAALTQTPGADVAEKMFRYFERLTAENLSDSDLEKLRQRILLLCQDATKLKLLMRSSHEGYECWMAREGTALTEIGDWAEAYAEYNGNNKDMGQVVYLTMFGALVKRPKYEGGGEIVLEKAQVVTSG